MDKVKKSDIGISLVNDGCNVSGCNVSGCNVSGGNIGKGGCSGEFVGRLRDLCVLRKELVALYGRVGGLEDIELLQKYKTLWRDGMAELTDEHGVLKWEIMGRASLLFADKVEPDRNILAAIGMTMLVREGVADVDMVKADWGDDVGSLVENLLNTSRFSGERNHVNQDNYRGLLLALAQDIRVIIIMIIENLALMRMINHHPDEEWVRGVAFEANCLYSQLAHRLGLYGVKGELEDLSLKYTNRDVYSSIAHKLNETKRARDEYIASFITPVKAKLEEAGLNFEIKGRTKSISSIWAKMKKQKVDLQHIYDLFAIRVIIDTPLDREKRDCWLAYSIVADMYRANPARMKDWISIPKSNGYESLHATVMGPENKWVEVQFRTRRMDLVAEKGLAAHWRYKGGRGDSTDKWMNNVRDILETAEEGPMQLMRDMRMDSFTREVFAFTPKGDLLRLSEGATVLDFAFAIHSNVGAKCVGAVINGRHQKITYKIHNGDTVEIVTSPQQSPKQDWLGIVTSSKARQKIKQSLGESKAQKSRLGKELMERRMRNRKLELDESVFMRLIKKWGYKHANDFFADLGDERVDLQKFLSAYVDETSMSGPVERVSAESFEIQRVAEKPDEDIITIGDRGIKGMSYRFAKCCNPIHGDEVFGFISSDGVVKIHKVDCPNAQNIMSRYPYRLIKVKWSAGEGSQSQLPVTLQIVGTDDIGIVTNITSIITKDGSATLRNISIDSHDGMFRGYLVLGVSGNVSLQQLIRKIEGVKGVKSVLRN